MTVNLDGATHRTQFDALVEFRNGRPSELREVKWQETGLATREQLQREAQTRAAELAGYQYIRITKADLAPHAQLIKNWRCALAFLAAARDLVLEPACEEILKGVARTGTSTLEKIFLPLNPALQPECLAAVFRCLQDGRLTSDLAIRPLCEDSVIAIPRGCHD